MKNNKFRDIKRIYNISKVNDGKIIVSKNDKIESICVYEVVPIEIAENSSGAVSNIITVYKEFLKEINSKFQLVVISKKIKVEFFKPEVFNDEVKNKYLYKMYVEGFKKALTQNNIYTTYIYLITRSSNEDSLSRTIYKLQSLGLQVTKVTQMTAIKNVLYKTMNKIY